MQDDKTGPDSTTPVAEPSPPPGERTFPRWMAQLPDDLKEDESLARYANLGEWAAAHQEQATQLQAAQEQLTTLQAAEQTRQAAEQAAAASAPPTPQDFEGLSWAPPEIPPQHADALVPKEWRGPLAQAFADAGVTPDQAQKLLGVMNGLQIEQLRKIHAADQLNQRKALDQIKQHYGNDFEGAMVECNRARKLFASDELRNLLNQRQADGSMLGDHPVLIQHFVDLYKRIGEDSFSPGETAGGKPPADSLEALYPNSPELHGTGRRR
ncbi:MAG: hypothetical protein JW820_10690 [Spirochaetales bacterium]|nr:hypothetical protein [Spirochaetales bacterium]